MTTGKINRILVPTDFSETADQALRYASGLARALGAHLTLVYADPFIPPIDYTATIGGWDEFSFVNMQARARRINCGVMPRRTSIRRCRTTSPSESIRRSTAS